MGAIADGLLLESIDKMTEKLITEWEGDEYITEEVKPIVDDEKVQAKAFIYTAGGFSSEAWDRENFRNNGDLANYVNNRIPSYLKSKSLQVLIKRKLA